MTSDTLRIVMAQINFLVGNIEHQVQQVIKQLQIARDKFHGDLIVFPELTLSGYPPEDLLLRSDFQQRIASALDQVQQQTQGIDVIVGFPHRNAGKLYNAAAWLRDGQMIAVYHKHHLPNYGVFDEKRYFNVGRKSCVVEIKNIPVGITICEDIWHPEPIQQARLAGAKLMIVLNASPFEQNKAEIRQQTLQQRIAENHIPMVYVNWIGGQDDLVFDGGSFAMNAQGEICQQAEYWQECLLPVDVNMNGSLDQQRILTKKLDPVALIYQALVIGVRDYIEKNHFPGAILGLSGGIDSALTLAIAVDAIGPERVEAFLLPSRYTADMSNEDAVLLANHLSVRHQTISIEKSFTAFLETLGPVFAKQLIGITAENLQSRCRGILLMAIANQTNRIVLTTGNKSEMAMGYATLYGDMAGGYAVLKDVFKTLVYKLAHYRNQISPVIPERIIQRPPTAELAPNQKDEDSLPPYSVLDQILALYVEQDKSQAEIVEAGFDLALVEKIITTVNRNEYKRRQAPPGPRISSRAFGRERRYPMTQTGVIRITSLLHASIPTEDF